MNILRNDKVVLIKAMDNLQTVGETFEVANITETAVILRNVDNKIAVGAIDIDVFDQYFKKPEEVKGWTPWQRLVNQSGDTIAFYRTNQKKVQVRISDDERGEASCNKCDEFNLYLGLNIAMNRCEIKALRKIRSDYERKIRSTNRDIMKQLNNDISTRESIIQQIIKSLGEPKQ